VDLEHPLEVGRDGLQLHAQAPVAGDCEAVLPHHRHHGGPVVLEDLRRAEDRISQESEIWEGREGDGGAGVGHSPTWPDLRGRTPRSSRGEGGGDGERRGTGGDSCDGGGRVGRASC
jgi:hypothetical protein